MEQLNKVEIKGRVGAVKVTKLGDASAVARMSVLTECIYKDQNGKVCIDSTRHNVVVWEGKAASRETLESLTKGDAVHVIGRLRSQKYTDAYGVDRVFLEIVAQSFEKLSNE